MMSRVPMLSDEASIWIDPKIALKSKIFMMVVEQILSHL